MKIEEQISELLYEHDCVIVPDFGGFVCNYAPARIDRVKHLFEPPGKTIFFNKGLTRNDGLLANYLSAKFKLSYSQALDTISREVKGYKENIKKDKRLVLDTIGLLYVDENGNILFQQDNKLNYLPDSFGLSSFYHLPADEERKIETVKENKKIRVYAAAAIITALVTSVFCFTLLEKQTNMRFSSLNLFPKNEIPSYAFSSSRYPDLPKPAFEPFTVAIANPSLPSPSKADVLAPSKTVPTTFSSYFSIIAGSFIEKEHADNLIKQFGKYHINLSIIGRSPQGLYMVGYGKFTSHDAAVAEKDNFRKSFIKDAWVKAF